MTLSLWPSRRSLATIATLLALVADSATGQQAPATAAMPFVELSARQPMARALEIHVLRERQVEVHLDVFDGSRSAQPQSLLHLEFFPDVSYTAALNRVTRTATGVTWSGSLVGVPSSTAVFGRVGGAVAGFVASPFGQFSLESAGAGGYTVQQIDSRGLQPAASDVICCAPAPSSTGTGFSDLSSSSSSPASQSVVDVLVAYTPLVIAAQPGGIDALRAKSLVMIGIADAALRDAGTGGARLAGTLPVEFVETTDGDSRDSETLERFTQLGTVHAALDNRAADVATLIVDENVTIGIAKLLEPQDSPVAGFSLVGRTSMAASMTFAHELGHNMGLWHDWYNSGSEGGWRPSSKGYVSLAGRFTTIMAYDTHCIDVLGGTGCSTIAVYSNPNRDYMGFPTGVPIGTSTQCVPNNPDNPQCDADAASTLTETAPIVAGYRHHNNRLSSGSSLSPGQFLRANGAGAACSLVYQGDGDLVARFTDGTAYWSSNTEGSTAGSVVMQNDGNLVVYDSLGAAVWASGTGGNPGAGFSIQGDCDLVVSATNGDVLWRSGVPTPMPLPHAIYEFSAEATTIQSGGWTRITFEGYGTEMSIWFTHPNGERENWIPPRPVSSLSGGYVHEPAWGTGTATLEATVTGAEGTTPAVATITITVAAP